MKILIAEDDFTSRTMLAAVLAKLGYEVISTCNGEEAFDKFQKDDAPQLAVLDWEMQGLDGISLCRKLREQERKEPLYLILLTARGESEDIVKGLEAGADDYIAKPYDNAELQARINVGRRIIMLQNEMREREKFQGVLEMAGAVCHELNQPLQVVSGYSEMLLMGLKTGDPNYEKLETIKTGIDRIGELTHKIMKIARYQSKPYLKSKIIDIEQASRNEKKEIINE
ncbi:MAG: response regulator [Desulfobacteraceae bacterium]|nr:MAG: response regulator [Desulfobacteraceae bacterium]